MNSLTPYLVVAATLGSGMMAGLFCAFSNFVMKALSNIGPAKGIPAMQEINLVIVNPAFLVVFLGTAVACALSLGLGWKQLGVEVRAWLALGGSVYLVGSIVVTIVFNVPLNDRLAAVDAGSQQGLKIWTEYLSTWVFWNHVRSIATINSTLLLAVAAIKINGTISN